MGIWLRRGKTSDWGHATPVEGLGGLGGGLGKQIAQLYASLRSVGDIGGGGCKERRCLLLWASLGA